MIKYILHFVFLVMYVEVEDYKPFLELFSMVNTTITNNNNNNNNNNN